MQCARRMGPRSFADDLELAELVGRVKQMGHFSEIIALVDVAADGAQVVGLVGGSVDVVVGVHVQLGMHGLGELARVNTNSAFLLPSSWATL